MTCVRVACITCRLVHYMYMCGLTVRVCWCVRVRLHAACLQSGVRKTTAGIIRTVAATRHQQPAQRRDLELKECRRRHQSDLTALGRGSFDALWHAWGRFAYLNPR